MDASGPSIDAEGPDAPRFDSGADAAEDSPSGDAGVDTGTPLDAAGPLPESAIRALAGEVSAQFCAAVQACPSTYATAVVPWCGDAFATLGAERLGAILVEAVASGRLILHPELLAACRAEVEANPCEYLYYGAGDASGICEAVFDGLVVEGGACEDSAECDGALVCANAGMCGAGRCAPRGVLGGACTRNSECASGFRCGATMRCVPLLADGAACGADTECAPGRLCIGAPRVCRQASALMTAPLAMPCSITEGPLCAPGLSCTFGGCVPAVGLGDSCVASIPDMCPASQHCDAELVGSGTCVDYPSAGAACVNNSCAAGAVCARGMCFRVASTGEACDASVECTSGRCSSGGVCSPAPPCVP